MDSICRDLVAEHDALDGIVAAMEEPLWDRMTPAEGWAIRDQLSHLGYFDRTAHLALIDPDGFRAAADDLRRSTEDPSIGPGRSMSGPQLLAWWRQGRDAMVAALRAVDPKQRLPWYGPDMGARSFATARLMETWAHGQDIVDALNGVYLADRDTAPIDSAPVPPLVSRPETDRLRHIAHIGIQARPFAYRINRLEMPDAPVRVELIGPQGEEWSWGPAEADDLIGGRAIDWCLVVTQRRHRDDVALTVRGPHAQEWVEIAQAFAGPPSAGRAPLPSTGQR